MAMSPSSLLAKLDELKKWQQTQQERLLRQHQSRLEETESGSSNYETIKGLSAFESFNNRSNENTSNPHNSNDQCYNKLSINKSKDGNENKSSEENKFYDRSIDTESNALNQFNKIETTNITGVQYISKPSEIKGSFIDKHSSDVFEFPTNAKPKRPYLKRGTGLEKFGMKAGDQKRPFNKMRPPQTAVHKRLAALRREEAAKKKINQEVPSSDLKKSEARKVGNDEHKSKNVRFSSGDNEGTNKSNSVKQKLISQDTNPILTKSNIRQVNKDILIRHVDNAVKKPKAVWLSEQNISNDNQTSETLCLREDGYEANKINPVRFADKSSDRNEINYVFNSDQNLPAENLASPRNLYPIQEELSRNEDDMSAKLEQINGRLNFQGVNKITMHDQFSEDKENNQIITPLKMPEISVQSKAKWFSVNNNNDLSEIPENSFPSVEVNADLMNCLKRLAAERFGNASNETREQSTQEILKEIDEITSGKLKPDESSYDTPDLHRKLIEYLQELARNCSEGNSCVSLQCGDTTAQRELQIFEQLEQKVMNSSFCSTNSSILELLSSTPFKKAVQEQKTVHFEESRRDSGAKRELDFNPASDESTINSEDLEERTLAEQQDWPNFEEMSATSSTSTQSLPQRNVIIKQNACVMTDDMDFSEIRISEGEEALKKRLKELDKEINNFRSENAKLQKLKGDVENERKELQRSKKKLEKELQDERIQMEFEIEEEKKKLAKEKIVFERYVKDLQNKPTRKEREEISALKAELANVKETLKLKETRNGTTQARLRNQLKTLEKENSNLKEEIDKLQKQNAKLTAAQKVIRKPSETKMLHEINKNLTKLTQDAKVIKHVNQAEKSIEKLDDSLEILEQKRRRRKKRISYETEYRRSYGNCTESDEDSENCSTSSRNEYRRKSKESTQSRDRNSASPPPEEAENYFNRSSRKKSEYSPNENHSSKKLRDAQVRKSNSPHHERRTKESPPIISEKENDKNSTNCDMTTFRNLSDLSIENNYDKVFGQKGNKTRNSSLNDTQGSTSGKVETILDDGSKETKYANGNVKTISADGNFVRLKYYNGDIKETKLLDGSIRYYYAQTEVWQTTLANGEEILEFSDGQIEKRYNDGSTETAFPNGMVKFTDKDGKEKITYPDGSVVNVNGDEKILLLPNGQKEIHTKEHKRREYPDGTVKILYPDGLQETRYSNGRIRMKDKDGHLLMDTHSDDM